MEAIIQVMESTIGARDPYTVGHQQRVTEIACAIGSEMKLSSERLRELRVASSLHDLGKVAVPLEILSKPGRLNYIELSLVKTHPQVGYDILKPLNLPLRINQIILQHHERMDGSGYPQGLAGKDLLLESRILGVADVVEAMCSHRPYRPALGLDCALDEIRQHRGTLYDPDVVDACIRLYDTAPAMIPELRRRPQEAPKPLPAHILAHSREARWNREKAPDLWKWLQTFPFPSRPLLHSFAALLLAGFMVIGTISH